MKKNSKQIRLSIRRNWQLYLFLLIPVVYIIIFDYVPMGGLVMAFNDYSMRKGLFGSDWVGLDNFIRFFQTYQSKRVITNTLILSAYTIIASFPIPICFALLINSLRGERFRCYTIPAYYTYRSSYNPSHDYHYADLTYGIGYGHWI